METSCGVVLVNYGTILLLQYPQGHWDLPKGHVETTDVDKKSTAARELEEETGISELQFIDGFEENTNYSFKHKGRKRHKRVIWFLATTEKISVKLSKEHREYMWLDWELAIDMTTHTETKGIITKAKLYMEKLGID
tara:strand:- start:278 stop:688 length:411 start_codon:yes stop_codon:yes gene_type:complete